jgi:hypothetical protein
MDQIGKMYQNRAMVLQEEVNRLEKLLEAVVQDPRPRSEALQKEMAAKQSQRENAASRGRVAPPSTTVRDEPGFQSQPVDKLPDPLKSDSAVPNVFARMAQSTSPLATSIQNIPELPGQFYDKHPVLSLGLAAYSAVPGGAYKAGIDLVRGFQYGFGINARPEKPEARWKSSNPGKPAVVATQAQMAELERLNANARINVELANREATARALGASPPIAPAPPQPPPKPVSVTTLFTEPKPATPSTVLGGNYEAPTFPKLFDSAPKSPNIVKSVSREILQGMKPGGLWGLGTRTVADSINDIRMDEYLSAGKPRAEAAVIGHGIAIDDAELMKQRYAANNTPQGPLRDSLNQVADELEKSIKSRTSQQTNLNATATAGENAIKRAMQPNVPRFDITKPIQSLKSKFNVDDFAQRYLNPLTRMGARNIGKGAAGIVGDLVAGEATERGLRSMGVENEDAIGLARGAVGGAAGVATVLGLGGAAIAAPAVLTGAALGAGMYGAHRLGRAAMEDIKIPFTGNSVDDYISGISAIRKTPGITRAELDRMRPPYKEETVGAKK